MIIRKKKTAGDTAEVEPTRGNGKGLPGKKEKKVKALAVQKGRGLGEAKCIRTLLGVVSDQAENGSRQRCERREVPLPWRWERTVFMKCKALPNGRTEGGGAIQGN